MPEVIATAIGVFAGTNVDDLLVLTVLFLAARSSGSPPWQIAVGQYAGIAVLVAVSAVAALGLIVVPDRWVGLLGLVPIALGVRALLFRNADPDRPVARGVPAIAGVTIANGADNIAVYTPLFRTIGVAGSVLTIIVFAVLVAVWLAAGSWLGSHDRVVRAVERSGHWLVPAVFIAVGAVILGGVLRT